MSLFKGIKKDPTNADIGKWMTDRSPFYQFGYRMAAEKLVQDYKYLEQIEKDTLVFPIIYLYRHHIELTLKDIIYQTQTLLQASNRYDAGHHRLLDLWDEVFKQYGILIQNISSQLIFIDLPSLNRQRGRIKELNKHDLLSFSFRYSTDKKGKKELENIDYISLDNFKSEIDNVLLALPSSTL